MLCVGAIHRAWIPGVELALSRLPEKVSFRDGRLGWPTPHPVVLANDRFLSLIVNPGAETTVDRSADIQIELGVRELRCRSLLGWMECPFPAFLDGDFGRSSALPWWDAWKPSLLMVLALVLWVALLISWALVASAYTGPAFLFARMLGKPTTLSQVWRSCAAALLPSGALVTAAGMAYACNQITLLLLGVFWLGHWLVGWVYLIGGIVRFPKASPLTDPASTPDPFATAVGPHPIETKKNPFHDSRK